MATIVTRAGKGSALTHAEGDANFTNLNTDKLENVSEDTTPTLGGELDANSNKIVNVTDPTADQDAATKLYVDNTVAGAAVTSSTATIIEVRNTTGTAIAKGVPVYIAGHSGSKILVAPADANDAAKMPAMGLMNATLSNNSDGEVISFGLLTGIDLSTFSIGDTLFVDTTPGGATFGGLTNTAPAGETSAIQNLGKVARNVSNGEFVVSGPGRSNATPNLDEDQFFLGNASNQSVAVDFSDAVEALSINNVLEDTSPQAGGDFDLNGNLLTDSTDSVTLDGTNGVVVTETDDGGSPSGNSLIAAEEDTNLFLVGDGGDITTSGYIQLTANGFANINKVGAGKVAINGYNMPDAIGSAGQVLTVDTQSNTTIFQDLDIDDLIALDDLSVTTGAASGGGTLGYNNATGVFTFAPADLSGALALTDFSVTTGASAETSALAYNNATGVFTFTPTETGDLIALDDLSVTTTAAGTAALSYNNTTGVFTYTPPDLSAAGGIVDVVEDTTPQLGGDLDVNGNVIVSVSNGDIAIEPDGSGNIDILTGTGGITLSTIKTYEEGMRFGRTGGTITLDHETAPIEFIQQGSDLTIEGLTTPVSGASVTLIIANSGTPYTITFDETNSTFYAVDGLDPTLGGLDVLNVFCLDDTTDAEVYIVTHVDSLEAIT